MLSARYVDIAPTTTTGIARGGTWAMVTKIYTFHNVSPILAIFQKGRTTIEWTWWRHRNANNKGLSTPKFFSKLSPWPHLMTRLSLWHFMEISRWIIKYSMRCAKKCLSISVTASSGKPTPELGFLPGRLRWTLFPKSATAIHSVAVDRPLNPPIERRTSHRRPTNRSSPMPRCQVMLWCAVGALLKKQR